MTSTDLNSVKAGEYELVAPFWDEILSKPGAPFDFKRHHQGDTVTLDVEQARRLVAAGAVVKPGDADRAAQPGAEQSTPPGAEPANEPVAAVVVPADPEPPVDQGRAVPAAKPTPRSK